MRPREIASKIASPVRESPSRPHATSRTRIACGKVRRTSASSAVPGASARDSPASTSATCPPASATSSSAASASSRDRRQTTR